jgi:hypothetical protein
MGRGNKLVEDRVLVETYQKTGSVWKTGEIVGLCGQSVHERLVKLGVAKKINVFGEKEKAVLLREYLKYRDRGQLSRLAKKMGRTKHFICRQAKGLGLTNQSAPRPYYEKYGANPYYKFHQRVRTMRGKPQKCEVCGTDDPSKLYEWANLTGDYGNPNDYKRMCRKCHRQYDKDRPHRDRQFYLPKAGGFRGQAEN